MITTRRDLLVARKLLTARKEKLDEAKFNPIIGTLRKKIYSHGQAIGRREAQEIGLPIDMPDEQLESARRSGLKPQKTNNSENNL
ncbi:MAG: hypothetical protein ACPLRX_01740 [Candidatus Saccharicenans sp.]